MNLTDLKKKGFKIVTNWQECNKNTIFLFDSKNQTKFIKYINLAIKKETKNHLCFLDMFLKSSNFIKFLLKV